jgi:NADH-quinone oxidoreductase subunit M
MVQPDLKKLVAYSSVAHLGFCVLGIFVLNIQGMEGAIYQMFSHGVSTGALFILVGLLYERRHTRLIREFGGLATSLPVYSTFFLIVSLSSLGLPMLNGFVGEFLIIVGSYHNRAVYAALAALGVVLAAVYLLWMYQRVFYGEITNDKNRNLPDCSALEKLILTTVVVVILTMGTYPQPFLRRMDHSVAAVMSRVQGTGNREQGREKREQGIGNREQGTENRKAGSGVARREPRAGRREAEVGAASPVPNSLFPVPSPGAVRLSPHTTYEIPHTVLPPIPYSLFPIPSTGGGR